jgi:hypothetical protein
MRKIKILFIIIVFLGFISIFFWLYKTDYNVENEIDNPITSLRVIEKTQESKYLADKDEVWEMLLENYSIQKDEDRYIVMKEIEDAEKKLGVENCDLLGIAIKESHLNQFSRGDSGYSWGVYQINSYYHEISQRTAYMINSASEWTYRNLIENGYPENRVYAIAKHNGSINKQAVQAYTFRVLLASERICSFR